MAVFAPPIISRINDAGGRGGTPVGGQRLQVLLASERGELGGFLQWAQFLQGCTAGSLGGFACCIKASPLGSQLLITQGFQMAGGLGGFTIRLERSQTLGFEFGGCPALTLGELPTVDGLTCLHQSQFGPSLVMTIALVTKPPRKQQQDDSGGENDTFVHGEPRNQSMLAAACS